MAEVIDIVRPILVDRRNHEMKVLGEMVAAKKANPSQGQQLEAAKLAEKDLAEYDRLNAIAFDWENGIESEEADPEDEDEDKRALWLRKAEAANGRIADGREPDCE